MTSKNKIDVRALEMIQGAYRARARGEDYDFAESRARLVAHRKAFTAKHRGA